MTSFSTGGIAVQKTWEPLSCTLHINMHVDVYMFGFESELPKLVLWQLRYLQLLRKARAQHEINRIGDYAFIIELCSLQYYASKVINIGTFVSMVVMVRGSIQCYHNEANNFFGKVCYCLMKMWRTTATWAAAYEGQTFKTLMFHDCCMSTSLECVHGQDNSKKR
jgi:hypothetical protein